MFQSEELKDHLESSNTIMSAHAVVAEWNMNMPGNIQKLGNYKLRQNDTTYGVLPNSFNISDPGNFYTGATNSNVVVELGLKEDSTTPLFFTYNKDKEALYYSLEDCLKPFRPRSGINKLSYFSNKYLPFENQDMYLRPRYYMPTKDDEFKYWRSFRTDSDVNVYYPSVVSQYGTLSDIASSGLTWTAKITNLQSVAELPVGKLLSASKVSQVTFGVSATIEAITGTGPWTANLTGLTSTALLKVGDRITATSSTGNLAGTGATQIVIKAILSSSSIQYEVIGGAGPTAGTVTAPKTVPGEPGIGEIRVVDILGPSSVAVSINGPTTPTYGTISNITINKYKTNLEYGISKNGLNNVYPIEDANPFVVYKQEVPANRLVIKLQTHVGSKDLGPFKTSGLASLDDPFFGDSKKTTPVKFKVQYLNEDNQWLDAYQFDEQSVREDGSAIFGADGHLSLQYGLSIPDEYKNSFTYISSMESRAVLPAINYEGNAYLVPGVNNTVGTLYVYNGVDYDAYTPTYEWMVGSDSDENKNLVKDFVNPGYFLESGETLERYREFVWIKGIRLAVETMNVPNVPLELIELSPRLVGDISDLVESFDLTKALADLASSSLPVGQLMAGVGSINLFDPEQIFNASNAWSRATKSGSIVANYSEKSVKFLFYEVIKNVNNSSYYVPLKTMYTDGFPKVNVDTFAVSISVRDFFFYFESLKSPRMLLTEVSLSQAICTLLDSVGFSNYVFKRKAGVADPVIPYFFIPPDQGLAETLSQLALATQSAMFFDEYNNFVVMTKEYLLDNDSGRTIDITLRGSDLKDNSGNTTAPANIMSIASKDKKVYNSGTINYTTRYIQKGGSGVAQNKFTDKQFVYSPSLLWEASGTETTATANKGSQTAYSLSAMPLNSDLSSAVPSVSNGVVINNTIDVGENAYWVSRFKGLLYANSEIIRYDAVQYNVAGVGNVWISSNSEYQGYFSKISFNGKIYPTGLLRIFSEPYYQTNNGITTLKNGAVAKHGRGQFGTPVVSHYAGLSDYWRSNDNVQGCSMDGSLLYTTALYNDRTYPTTTTGEAGVDKATAQKSQRTGVIRNFLSSKYYTETNLASLKTTTTGTVQSSALVMTGPDFESTATPSNFVSYVYKPIGGAFKHFGTRVRIIGKIESAGDRSQTVVGGMTYFNVNGTDPTQTVSIGGGSAGISFVDPKTNNGYYFEIAALTSSSIENFLAKNEAGEATISIENILFYKVKKNSGSDTKAVPIRLWGGQGNILVDDGNFAGQFRYTGEANPTVYDLAMEYVDIDATTREFYLYINQKLVQKVTDTSPIAVSNPSIGLFVRGTSKAMFENVYSLSKNYSNNTVFDTNTPIAPVFGDSDNFVNASEALNKYALSGAVQDTYLSSINPTTVPAHSLYFEEFGTIMREAAYFNIKYDRAYPALYARIAPTFNRIRGYTVSGFTADSYGAEFLVFNNTDTILNLDDKSSNYLRIQGIAFTSDTTNTITVDDYLKQRGNLSNPELKGESLAYSPYKYIEQYEKVRQSRLLYGRNDFTLDSIYIQDTETAESILGWIIEKNLKPRKLVGVSIFSNPMIQLGDLVNISYQNTDGVDLVSDESAKYVVYNITYARGTNGPDMTIYLSEV